MWLTLMRRWLSAGDEGDDYVGGVTVEVLPSPIVDGGCAWIGVARCDLDVPQWNAGVESSHNERCSQHVGVHKTQPGPLPDGPDPAVSRTPVEALPVASAQDRALASLADG
jgi:hypothetical protein